MSAPSEYVGEAEALTIANTDKPAFFHAMDRGLLPRPWRLPDGTLAWRRDQLEIAARLLGKREAAA